MNPKRAFWFFCLLLAGCGFHLRGTLLAEAPPVAIEGASYPLQLALEKEFSRAGGKVDPKAGKKLLISHEEQEERILSLTPRGAVGEFELLMRVRYKLLDEQGMPLLPESEMQVTRSYVYSDQAVHAKEWEREKIVNQMRDEAARRLIEAIVASRRTSRPT